MLVSGNRSVFNLHLMTLTQSREAENTVRKKERFSGKGRVRRDTESGKVREV